MRKVREVATFGVAGIWITECLTDMISPDSFSSLGIPYLKQLIDAIRAAGMKSIYYYCGNPVGKWDQIISTGADAIAFEESKKDFVVNIEDVVRRVGGRCTVLGNLDVVGVLQCGSKEQLRAEISRQIRTGRKNNSRFIMSLGSPVTPQTPIERVKLYCDLVHNLGDS